MSTRAYNRLNTKGILNVAIIVSTVVFAASLVLFVGAPARASEQVNVQISGTTSTLFTPQGVTINVGDTVEWSCLDGAHTTTSNPGQAESWDSGPLMEMETFSWTFTHAGNFTYTSTASGDAGQVGWVFVQPGTSAPEFPGYLLYITVAAAVILALLVERRLRA